MKITSREWTIYKLLKWGGFRLHHAKKKERIVSELAEDFAQTISYNLRNIYQETLKEAKTKYKGRGRPRKTDYAICKTVDSKPYKVLNK